MNVDRITTAFGDLAATVRLVRRLPGYLRRPLEPAACRTAVRERLARREEDFLAFVRRAVYRNPASPYRALLRHAGCDFGDLERLVRADGVDTALAALCRAGVYLTVDEYKGRRPVVRGSASFAFDPRRLRNPLAVPAFVARTGGSRGPATRVALDVASVRDRAVNLNLALHARGGADWKNAVWSVRGVVPVLWYSACGVPADRWFLLRDPAGLGASSRFLWSLRLVTWTSRAARVPLPSPEHAPHEAPRPIVDWMAKTLRAGGTPHLWCSPSGAVRLCRAAAGAGIDIAGARFTVTGEPVTAARLDAIRSAGGDASPDYGSVDSGGTVAYGCLAPAAPDDVHLFADLNALIPAPAGPLPRGALLVSNLRATAPFVLLNVSMGDRATLSTRACGCPLEDLGWTTHLHDIGSYEKLTAGGVTFEDTDVVRLLDEVLPHRFGGGPTDYQLVEEDDADDADDAHSADDAHGAGGAGGAPRLRLLVGPAVGDVRPAEVVDVFLDALAASSENARDMALVWRHSGMLTVVREAPRASAGGKILHLVARRSGDGAGAR